METNIQARSRAKTKIQQVKDGKGSMTRDILRLPCFLGLEQKVKTGVHQRHMDVFIKTQLSRFTKCHLSC